MKRLGASLIPIAAAAAACLGDPVGTGGTLVVRAVGYPPDSVIIGAPGHALPQAIAVRVTDQNGSPVPGVSVEWRPEGVNARVTAPQELTAQDGTARTSWVLGTIAVESQRLTVVVRARAHEASISWLGVARPVEVAALQIPMETTTVRLGVPQPLVATATDPYGNAFVPTDLHFHTIDSSLATVDDSGRVRALRRGIGRVVASAAGRADTAWIHAVQIVSSIKVSVDTVRFHSIGQQRTLAVDLFDDQGLPVADSLPGAVVVDTSVFQAQIGSPVTLESRSNGVTALELLAGGVERHVVVVVAQQAVRSTFSLDSISFDALQDTATVHVVFYDSADVPLSTPAYSFWSSDSTIASVSAAGLITAHRNGGVAVGVQTTNGVRDSIAAKVSQRVARVVIPMDSMRFESLQAVQTLNAVVLDRLGSPVEGAVPQYLSSDSSVVSVNAAGTVRAIANGTVVLLARAASESTVVHVQVQQRPVRVLVPSDTIRFVALGETQSVTGIAVDSLGYRVDGVVSGVTMSDTTVAQRIDSTTMRSRANGVAGVTFSVASLPAKVTVVVSQVPDTVVASLGYVQPIASLPFDALLPVSCEIRDRNGFSITGLDAAANSSTGTVVGGTCSSLHVRKSGLDTLRAAVGTHLTSLPIVVAIRPSAASALGNDVVMDSFPAGGAPWAPTAWQNSSGQTELFSTAYFRDSLTPNHSRGDLHRLVSSDGTAFRYDGVAVQRDSAPCALNGSGIENVAIVPRLEAPGWRMYYAGGSFVCYGWQVFSAISADGAVWTKEPGIRLGNGFTTPNGVAPYPVGEGMYVYQLPSGEFRMIAGSFEHVTPVPVNTWQIAEWSSIDQLNWTYLGTILTTRDMPPEGQGSVYGPTIVNIAPGLWRMVFTADNRGHGSFHSVLWSAVSTDRHAWQVEGQVAGGPGTNLYYASMVGGQLFFLRQDAGGPVRLETVSVSMP